MAQGYDKYELDNQTGQSFRFALNDILEASATQNSGDNSPNTANTSYPYQVWVDTTNDIVKIRDAATAGSWYSLYSVDSDGKPTGAVYYGSYTIATNDTAGTGGTTAITVDTSQNVGIGTSPNNLLEVRGTSDGQNVLHLSNSAGTTDGTAENQVRVTCNGNSNWGNLDIQAYQTIFTQNGTEKVRIDSSGNVGIGTSSPDAVSGYKVLTINGSTGGMVRFYNNDVDNGSIYSSSTNLTIYGVSGQAVRLFAGDAERMKIKDSTYTEINVAGTTSSDTGSFIFVNSSGTRYWSISSNSTNFFIADDNFSNYAYLSQNPTSWQFASDARLKENIADISYGIETIKQLQPRQFNFISNPAETVLGFVAQELRPVVPEAVSGVEQEYSDDDTPQERAQKSLGVAKDTLIPVLVKALQEAVERIEELEAKVTALESA